MMDAIEKYYFKLGIETEIEKYEKRYNNFLTLGNWTAQKMILGDYEETIEKVKNSLGEDLEFIGELETKLKDMESKRWKIE